MHFISHRGNLTGKDKFLENYPTQIDFILESGFDCEVDVWYHESNFYLGHDQPNYKVTIDYLKNDRLWCHAKNVEALSVMLKENIHCFFIDGDKATLTSKNFIWLSPTNKQLFANSICVMPESDMWDTFKMEDLKSCLGVCTDNIEYFKQLLK